MSDPKSCEARLGLVLYGGVSLAIYINGVVREFFEAVRGRGVYKLIKVLTDSDVVVDVISGTSAGGVNGILLAYALCNDREFADTASLWRRDGGIRELLRDPDGRGAQWDSLLDSEGVYQPAVEAAFRYMGAYAGDRADEPSPVTELDLYVTGTDVDGAVWTEFDDAGHPIDIKEHRAVFVLKHRSGRPDLDAASAMRKAAFNPRPRAVAPELAAAYEQATYEALGKLARLTSCFPAAFTAVRVSHSLDRLRSADARLQDWGRLGKESTFLDGGVLDNKPFTYTLNAIFSRHADRRVFRTLFYVEPDPETLAPSLEASRPNLFQAVSASLIGIPGYESIATDLKRLTDHNSKVEQYRRIVKDCRERTIGGAAASVPKSMTWRIYRRSRLVALSERVVRGVLRRDGREVAMSPTERRIAGELVKSFDMFTADTSEVGATLLRRFDVPYRLRRAYHICYLLHDLLHPDPPTAPPDRTLADRYLAALRAVNRHIELLEIIRAAMESVIDDYPFAWQSATSDEVWTEVGGVLDRLVDATYTSLPNQSAPSATPLGVDVLAAFYAEISVHVASIARKAPGRAPTAAGTAPTEPLLERVDKLESSIIETLPTDDIARRTWDRFDTIDELVFPIELVGDLEQKDVVPIVRISPRDAEKGFSRRGFSDKIAGDAFFHFGGFFKRSWRSNDILWGRLDGACQVIETLLERGRLEAVLRDPEQREAIRERLANAAFQVPALFPRAGKNTHHKLSSWLDALTSADDRTCAAALTREEVDANVELLIEATQLEIIHNDLPAVITDALEEQSEWGEVPVASPPPDDGAEAVGARPVPSAPGDVIFKPLDHRLDPFVAAVAAAERMRAGMREVAPDRDAGRDDSPRPRETILGRFFRQSYRVGSENLTRDIPPRVLLELLAVALLVARNCVLAAFGPHADKVRKSWLYRIGVAWPLRFFYLLTLALRGPQRRREQRLLGAIVVGLILTIGGVVRLVMAQEFEWLAAGMVAVGVVMITISALVWRFTLRARQRRVDTVSRAISAIPTPSRFAAHIDTECSIHGGTIDVRVTDAWLYSGANEPLKVRVNRMRLGLAQQSGRKSLPPALDTDFTVASGTWQSFGRWGRAAPEVVLTPDGTPLPRWRDTLRVPQGSSLEAHWLIAEIETEIDGGPEVVTVHSRRYLADPTERD